MSMKKLCAAAVLAGGACVSTIAGAGEMFDASAVVAGEDMTKIFPVSETHALLLNHTTYEAFETKDPNSPMNGAKGDCFGTSEVMGKSVSGSGNCTLTDKNGAKIHISWTMTGEQKSGGSSGVWSIVGGSGPWAKTSGGGKFSADIDRQKGTVINRIDGAFTVN